MRHTFKKSVSFALSLAMIFGILATLPFTAFAANDYTINSTTSTDNYYNLISKKDWDIAPGITESEIVLNNDDGSRRQVLFVMEADLNNEYVKVVNSYMGMVPEYGTNYRTGVMSEQAAYAEANGYGNVVGAMNTTLSWYNTEPYLSQPDRVGEPLGFIMLDAEVLFDPANCGYNYGKVGFPSVLVINKDYDENGNPRPADIPKVEMPQITCAADLDGWEDQVIPASSGYIVKDGVNTSSPNHTDSAPRSVVGIKPDGTVVIMLNDGRQSPYSAGMSMYELAEVMLDLGCSYAVNCDGGGSSTYLSQRPGEELKVNNSPSDGAERPTTTGILFISTAPATGEFARANISSENKYYTPGSTVKFDVLGTDLVGTEAEIPADVEWQLKDDSFGTIKNGVFTSNGKTGEVTVQMVWNGSVVGEASIEIVIPTAFSFSQKIMTVPFGKEVTIGLTATINDGINNVVLKSADVVFTTTNAALGTFNGLQFTSVSEENAPANLKSTLTATFVHNTELVATAELNLGKGSEVLFDFEESSDIDGWNIADVNGNDNGFYQHLSYATSVNGQVHDGTGSMRVEMNPISASGISSGGYGQSDLFLDEGIIVENAKSIGFWAYIPDEYEHCWIRVLYWIDANNDGKFETKNTISIINQPEVYNTVDESGWRYFSVDVSAYDKVLIPGIDCKDILAYNASKNDANNFRFIEFMFPHTNTNDLWKTYGTINGLQTVYIDNITVDYSDAVDDREAPIFSKVELAGNDSSIVLKKYETPVTKSNLLTVSAFVAENTTKTNATGLDLNSAKAYVDGVEVSVTYSNGRMTISEVAVADGVHRVKFEIADNMGNKSVVIRLVEVKSGVDASTVQVVPADPTLNSLYGGSLYWMNVNATDIETIKAVKLVVDLNYGNHWELDHMELAKGFTATYDIDEENNTATIVIVRTGNNNQTGAATLASLPIRVIYYDTDIKIDGYDAVSYWFDYGFWPYDLKVDVDMGEITYVDGYTSNVLGAFSNEEFSVDTELQTGFSDLAFKNDRGTAHVHTPVALVDKMPTCTENGYVGRTYCEVCASVVEWGDTISVLSHNYVVYNKQLVCECGDVYAETGLAEVNGNYYYISGDVLIHGWLTIDNEWHYFDATTYTSIATLNNGYVTFKFEKTGKLVSGEWYHSTAGSRYYYGPSYYTGSNVGDRNYTIDGKSYYFNEQGYCLKGYSFYRGDEDFQWYDFGDDGACRGTWDYTGLYELNGYTYSLINGVSVYGFSYVDGAYYYSASANSRAVVTNVERVCGVTNGLIIGGTYRFGADGKMLDNVVCNDGGVLYYYVLGVKSQGTGRVELNGQMWNIAEDGKVDFTGTLKDASDAIFTYTNGVGSAFVKQGIFKDEDGAIRYYVDGTATYAGLVQDADGNYYYINSSRTAVTNRSYEVGSAKANGLLPAGTYYFGEDGKMINPPTGETPDEPEVPEIPEEPETPVEPEVPAVKNGLVKDEDGAIRYYVDGTATYAGLVQDADGNYYYINSSRTAVTNRSYEIGSAKANGLLPAGTYYFGEDGKMILG